MLKTPSKFAHLFQKHASECPTPNQDVTKEFAFSLSKIRVRGIKGIDWRDVVLKMYWVEANLDSSRDSSAKSSKQTEVSYGSLVPEDAFAFVMPSDQNATSKSSGTGLSALNWRRRRNLRLECWEKDALLGATLLLTTDAANVPLGGEDTFQLNLSQNKSVVGTIEFSLKVVAFPNSSLHFGKEFEHSVALCESAGIPHLLQVALVKLLEPESLEVEGIIRVPGQKEVIQAFERQFDNHQPLHFDSVDPLDVAGTVKAYLMALPSTLPTSAFWDRAKDLIDRLNEEMIEGDVEEMKQLLADIPAAQLTYVKWLFTWFHLLAEKADVNKMSHNSISISIGPTILIPPEVREDPHQFLTASKSSAAIMTFLLENLMSLDLYEMPPPPTPYANATSDEADLAASELNDDSNSNPSSHLSNSSGMDIDSQSQQQSKADRRVLKRSISKILKKEIVNGSNETDQNGDQVQLDDDLNCTDASDCEASEREKSSNTSATKQKKPLRRSLSKMMSKKIDADSQNEQSDQESSVDQSGNSSFANNNSTNLSNSSNGLRNSTSKSSSSGAGGDGGRKTLKRKTSVFSKITGATKKDQQQLGAEMNGAGVVSQSPLPSPRSVSGEMVTEEEGSERSERDELKTASSKSSQKGMKMSRSSNSLFSRQGDKLERDASNSNLSQSSSSSNLFSANGNASNGNLKVKRTISATSTVNPNAARNSNATSDQSNEGAMGENELEGLPKNFKMTRSRTLNHDPRDTRLSLQRLFDSPSHSNNNQNHNPHPNTASPMKTIDRKPMIKRGSVREKLFSNPANDISNTADDLRKTMLKRNSMQKTKSQTEKKRARKAAKNAGGETSELDDDSELDETPSEMEEAPVTPVLRRKVSSRRNSESSKNDSPSRKRKQEEHEAAMLVVGDMESLIESERKLKKFKVD